MTKNINDYERLFRGLFGFFVFSMMFWEGKSVWLIVIGLFFIATGIGGKCPFYWSMGVTTEVDERKKKHWTKKGKLRPRH